MTSKIAIFIDCENISAYFISQIFENLESKGKIIIARAFKDFTRNSWRKEIELYGLEAIHITTHKSVKNTADLKLQMNVLDTLAQGVADSYVIVSSDSDFRELALRIKSLGFKAIGMGETKTPDILRNAYDEFMELKVTESSVIESADSKILDILKQAISELPIEDDEGYKYVAKMGYKLKQIDSNLNLDSVCVSLGIMRKNGWSSVFDVFSNDITYKYGGKGGATFLVKLRDKTI